MKLSTKIKTLREDKRLTTKELAEMVGVTHATCMNWEKGTRPRDKYLKPMANIFGITVTNLLDINEWNTDDPTRNDLYLVEYKETFNEDGKKKRFDTVVWVNGVWLSREIKRWKEIE